MEVCDVENGEMEIGDFDSEDVIIDELGSALKRRDGEVTDNENLNLSTSSDIIMNITMNESVGESVGEDVDVNTVDSTTHKQHTQAQAHTHPALDSNTREQEGKNSNENENETDCVSAKTDIEKTENLKRKNSSVHFGPIKNFF
jgi:hypothetical protein